MDLRLLARPGLWLPVIRARLSLERLLWELRARFPGEALRSFLRESRTWKAYAESRLEPLRFPSGRAALDGPYAQAVYVLVRALKPKVVVETGVANGYSSLVILAALRENGDGRLHSIGWDERGDHLPEGKAPGWLVPDDLRARWELLPGRSREALPPVLARLGRIDLFLHDSDHSEDNQSFELERAWSALNERGAVLCDDAGASGAFSRLAASSGAWSRVVGGRLGVALRGF